MRANSLSRQSAKLLRVSSGDNSSPSLEKPAAAYLVPPRRFDSLRGRRGQIHDHSPVVRPSEPKRNTSENAAAVQEVIDGY